MLPRSTEIQPCVASIRPSPSFSIQLSPKTWRGYPSDTCLYFYVLAFSSHRLHLPSACHGFGFALSWLRLVVPCLAMLCLGLGMPWPCVGMPRRAVALACLGLGMPCLGMSCLGIARHFESEAIGSLTCHALPCCPHMPTACPQMSTEFFKPCQTPFLLKFPRTISSP